MLTKLEKKLWQSLKCYCLFNKKLLGQVQHNLLRKEPEQINLGMLRKPIGLIHSGFCFAMLCSIINIKNFKKSFEKA